MEYSEINPIDKYILKIIGDNLLLDNTICTKKYERDIYIGDVKTTIIIEDFEIFRWCHINIEGYRQYFIYPKKPITYVNKIADYIYVFDFGYTWIENPEYRNILLLIKLSYFI